VAGGLGYSLFGGGALTGVAAGGEGVFLGGVLDLMIGTAGLTLTDFTPLLCLTELRCQGKTMRKVGFQNSMPLKTF